MDWKKIKQLWKKTWHFIWKEDSLLSWIVNIVLAFIIIKFVIYPGLGLMLGTDLPVVAVISESMDHGMTTKCTQYNSITEKCTQYRYEICGQYFDKRNSLDYDEYWAYCGSWYENKTITKEEFSEFPMKNGFRKGDIIILRGVDYDKLKVGEVIVFNSNIDLSQSMGYPIIHRVISKNDVIETKGDHNPTQIQTNKLNEKYITKDQLIGKAWIKIPFLGYIKIWFVELIRCVTFNGCQFSY